MDVHPDSLICCESSTSDLTAQPWNMEWKEITNEFIQSARDLPLGYLMHDGKFSLFEAMSAIELMDPKMDSGMTKTSKPMGFEQALERGIVPVSNISWVELLTIYDALMSCLVTWLEGHSLANTLFTNLYLHKPDLIKHKHTHAVCCGILKLAWLQREIIINAAVFEEEDFNPLLYGFDLVTWLSINQVTALLKESEDEILKTIRKTKSQRQNSEEQLMAGVLSRIRLLRSLINALSYVLYCCSVGLISNAAEKPKHAKWPCRSLEELEKQLRLSEQIIEEVVATVKIGISAPENDDDFSWLVSFSPGVNARLLPPTFPRKTRMFNREEAAVYIQNIIWRLQLATLNLQSKANSFNNALSFIREFSTKTRNCVLSRSALQLCYLPNEQTVMNECPFQDVIKDSFRTFVSPPVLQLNSPILDNESCAIAWKSFVEDCCKVFGSLIQICGHNRARQREKIVTAIEDLAALQAEADRVDGLFHSVLQDHESGGQHLQTLGAYVLYQTLCAMREYLTLGFELQLFALYEYAYVYWYMAQLLYKWLANVVDRASNFLLKQLNNARTESKSSRGDKKKKISSKREQEKKRRLLCAGTEEIIYWQAMEKLSHAYFIVMLGLERVGSMVVSVGLEERLRYEHRMCAFACLNTPPYITYEQYQLMSRQPYGQLSDKEVWEKSAQTFDEARALLGHLENVNVYKHETQILLRLCKKNAVIVRLLATGHKAQTPPTLDFSAHKLFPALEL